MSLLFRATTVDRDVLCEMGRKICRGSLGSRRLVLVGRAGLVGKWEVNEEGIGGEKSEQQEEEWRQENKMTAIEIEIGQAPSCYSSLRFPGSESSPP